MNRALRSMVARDKRSELTAMLASQVCQEKNVEEWQLLDIIEDRFEDAKKRFNPYDECQLRVTPVHIGIDGVEIGQLFLDRCVPCPVFVTITAFHVINRRTFRADVVHQKGFDSEIF